MLINFTNHPSSKWSAEQTAVASTYGEILDIPFPDIDPLGSEQYIAKLVETYAKEITGRNPAAVLCQGEMTFAFSVAQKLVNRGTTVLAACSKREATEKTDTEGMATKTAEFKFVRFRKYFSKGD
jgi:hypothetical protein